MKLSIIKILCFSAAFILTCGCGSRKHIDADILKDGDIIFQNKKSKNSELMTVLTAPKFNHLGILVSRNGKWYVLEASQPVELTPVSSWINSGEKAGYAVKRLKDADTVFDEANTAKLNEAGKEYLGKPYDVYFSWSDDAFYASELVWKIFKKALDIELCVPQILGDFDLTGAARDKVKETYGNKVPLYEEVISPDAVFNSGYLITIMDNG
jgi:hypothetical protein